MVTRPWGWGDEGLRTRLGTECEIYDPPVTGEFRELVLGTDFKFSRPGAYRIKALYKDPHPELPTEEDLLADEKLGIRRELRMRMHQERLAETLGIIESNEATVDVRP